MTARTDTERANQSARRAGKVDRIELPPEDAPIVRPLHAGSCDLCGKRPIGHDGLCAHCRLRERELVGLRLRAVRLREHLNVPQLDPSVRLRLEQRFAWVTTRIDALNGVRPER